MTTPCALVTSCSALEASELVKRILFTTDLPPPVLVLENIFAYPWHIETKYYSADVSLCTSDVRTIGDKPFADSVQAFVTMIDTTQQSCLDQVALWLPYLHEINPPVQILVCHQCRDDDVVSRDTAIGWCLDNAFELVELDPLLTDEDDTVEDDFKETVGVQRIIEALSSHSWPNLVMKDKPLTFGRAYLEQLKNESSVSNSAEDVCGTATRGDVTDMTDSDDGWSQFVTSESPFTAHVCTTHQQAINESENGTPAADTPTADEKAQHSNSQRKTATDAIIDSIVVEDTPGNNGSGDIDGESFEKLFDQLRIMKAAAAGMPLDQRKKYAEQVTMQFWQAIGGSDDEFEGLSD